MLSIPRYAGNAEALCIVQGLSPGMPDRRRYGENENRVFAPLQCEAWTPCFATGWSPNCLVTHPSPGASRGRLNLRDKVPGLAWLSKKLLGFAARRSLPQWRKPWQPSGGYSVMSDVLGDGKDLILFGDTFNRVFERENLEAAERVLRLLGYRLHHVLSERRRCVRCAAGAPTWPQVKIGKALGEAVRTIETLLPYVQSGARIVGLEPSCILTFRDEFFRLPSGKRCRNWPDRRS